MLCTIKQAYQTTFIQCASSVGVSRDSGYMNDLDLSASIANLAKSSQVSTLEINYDIRSLVTAMAINWGINDVLDLVLISKNKYSYSNIIFLQVLRSKVCRHECCVLY